MKFSLTAEPQAFVPPELRGLDLLRLLQNRRCRKQGVGSVQGRAEETEEKLALAGEVA